MSDKEYFLTILEQLANGQNFHADS